MQYENIKETVSEEAVNTEQKIYVVTEPSYFDGMFYNSGEIIRTDKKPSLYMKKITESQLKSRTAEKRVYAEDPSVEVERLRKQMDVAKQKQTLMF